MYEKVIEVDIWSTYGCFNKSFSNKGGLLTYPIPPKTEIIGMIGSVLGIDFDDYEEIGDKRIYSIEKFYDIQISVQALFDLKTARLVYNNCDKTIANIYQDILVNPKYKVFISFPIKLKEYESEFIEKIKNHSTIYNLYMGRNEFPLNYEYLRSFDRIDKSFTDEDDIEDFKVIGFIKRSKFEEISIHKIDKFSSNVIGSKPFFEYLINDYPIKRYNFTNFKYEFISFYPELNNEINSYFYKLELKDDSEIILTDIGDDKWIYLI